MHWWPPPAQVRGKLENSSLDGEMGKENCCSSFCEILAKECTGLPLANLHDISRKMHVIYIDAFSHLGFISCLLVAIFFSLQLCHFSSVVFHIKQVLLF